MALRRLITSALVVAVLAVVGICGNNVAFTRDRAELAYNSRNLIRLHILAHSDRAIDQQVKEKVRDAILAETRRLFMRVRDPAEALRLARAERGTLAALAAKTARKAGALYRARVEVGSFAFPARIYPFGTLPAGEYKAVRVILGRGQGKNWWCVLFPPLCFLSPQGNRISGPVRVRVAFFERLLRRNGLLLDSFWQGWARFWRLPVTQAKRA